MPEPATTRPGRSGSFAWDIRWLETIDSTNRYVLDAARSGARAGFVAVADYQTAGRGRLGRVWEAAPKSSLLVSVLLRPDVAAEQLGRLTMAAGLALAEAVEEVTGIRSALKWPNDLVVGDRKLAGLLAEADVDGGRVAAVVLGAGCNLSADALPADLAATATTCESERGRPVDRDAVLGAFLDRLGARLADLDTVADDYRARSCTLGRRVRVDVDGGRAIEGDAVAVSDDGALAVRTDDGVEVSVAVGEVVHLRRAHGTRSAADP